MGSDPSPLANDRLTAFNDDFPSVQRLRTHDRVKSNQIVEWVDHLFV